ncbi:hypothetical protein ACVWWO_003159 [Bradyrhizobium sp. F1.13.1]
MRLRHNESSQLFSTTHRQFEPMHRRKANGDVDRRPWCQDFYAAMRLQLSAWAALLDASNGNHGLLRPILLHCAEIRGSRRSEQDKAAATRRAYADIPPAVEANRQYEMPIRYARAR